MRKKRITKEQVLNGAYKLVSEEGFSKFTARNIATTAGISTQPIYLEFKNMDHLKEELFEMVYKHLSEEVYPVKHTGDAIVDLAFNYINFAQTESKLYSALFVESEGNERMYNFSQQYFTRVLKEDDNYKDLSPDQVQNLLHGTWVVATGIANLTSSGTIHPTEEQIIQLMKDAIAAISGLDHDLSLEHL